jgi:hypothetical protein
MERRFASLSGLMLKLNHEQPGASILWPEEMRAARLYVATSTLCFGRAGVLSHFEGQLVCLTQRPEATLQADQVASRKAAPHPYCGLIFVAFLFTDRGLDLARLTAAGYGNSPLPL